MLTGIYDPSSAASSSASTEATLQAVLAVLTNIKTDTALLTATNTLLTDGNAILTQLQADGLITNQQLIEANTELDNIEASLNAIQNADANYYTAIGASQAAILAQLVALNVATGSSNTNLATLITNTQTLITQTDQVETLLTSIQADLNTNSTTEVAKLEELRVLLAAINANTDGLEAQLTLLSINTDGLEGLITTNNTLTQSTNDKLDLILAEQKDDVEIETNIVIDANGVVLFRKEITSQDDGTITLQYLDASNTVVTPVLPLQVSVSKDDKEVTTNSYKAIAAGTGYVIGDSIKETTLINTSATPVTVAKIWVNHTQGTVIAAPTLTDLEAQTTDSAAVSGPLNTVYVTEAVDVYEQRHPDTNAVLHAIPTVADLVIPANSITVLEVNLIEEIGLGSIDLGINNKLLLNQNTNNIGYNISFEDEEDKTNSVPITIKAAGATTVIQVITKAKL